VRPEAAGSAITSGKRKESVVCRAWSESSEVGESRRYSAGCPAKAPYVRWVALFHGSWFSVGACRTLDAYTVKGAWNRGRFHTDRRSFGPGARTVMHADRPHRLPEFGCSRLRRGKWKECPAFFLRRRPPPRRVRGVRRRRKNAGQESREATQNLARRRQRGRSAPPEIICLRGLTFILIDGGSIWVWTHAQPDMTKFTQSPC
jgi:hypothetical protein